MKSWRKSTVRHLLGVPGLVNIQKANWKMVIEIVEFPIKNGGSLDFPINSMVDLSIVFVNVYQAGYTVSYQQGGCHDAMIFRVT